MCPHCGGEYCTPAPIEGFVMCGDCGNLVDSDEWDDAAYPEDDF